MNAINSIEWHEECLSNSKKYERRLSDELNDLHTRLSKLRLDNCIYSNQITQAKLNSMKSFDKTKFLIKKNKKENSK